MQANVTVIDVEAGHTHDIVLHADPASTVGAIAAAIVAAIQPKVGGLERMAQVVPLSRQRAPRRDGCIMAFSGWRRHDVLEGSQRVT